MCQSSQWNGILHATAPPCPKFARKLTLSMKSCANWTGNYTRLVIATLPMYDYDWREVRQATDAWWGGLARHMRIAGFDDVPESLNRAGGYTDAWSDDRTVLSQTCGYPLTHEFAGKLHMVATPIYAADGCVGSSYSSVILARAGEGSTLGEFRGKRAAVNNPDSMSGMLALRLAMREVLVQRATADGSNEAGRVTPGSGSGDAPFFGEIVWSGGHLSSVGLLRAGSADVCTIDAVCFALTSRYRPDLLDGIEVLGRTPLVPALPYVTPVSRSADEVSRVRAALFAAATDPTLAEAREALLIDGFETLPIEAYDRILQLEAALDDAPRVDTFAL